MQYKEQLKSVQNKNLNTVLFCLRKYIELTPNELAEKSHISVPSVHKYLNYMVKNNIAIETELVPSNIGRKAIKYTLNSNYSNYLLISIGATSINAKVTNYFLKDIDNYEKPINFAMFKDCLLDVIKSATHDHPNIHCALISCHANIQDGVVVNFPNANHINGLNLKGLVQSEFNISCFVQTDIEVLANNSFKYLENEDYNALILHLNVDEVGLASIINKDLHIGRDYLSKSFLPTTFNLPNNKAYELISKVAITIIGPSVIILYSAKSKREYLDKLVEIIKASYPDNSTPKLIICDNYLNDIFYGLKMAAHRNTKLQFID